LRSDGGNMADGKTDDVQELRQLIREEASEAIRQNFEEDETPHDEDYPKEPFKDTFFTFLKGLIKGKDTSKYGNVDRTELGGLPLTVRGYKDIHTYLKTYSEFTGDKDVEILGKYFQDMSEVSLATSLSKNGFFLTNAVTTVKKSVTSSGETQKKWSLFGFGKKKEGSET